MFTNDQGLKAPKGKGLLTTDLLAKLASDLSADDFVEYSHYQDDPVGFMKDELQVTMTEDIITLCNSVRDNKITIARSANATGKTFIAGRIAPWFFKAFPGSKVYTAAAPPESNLKRVLWGEIGSVVYEYPDMFVNDKVTTMHIERNPDSFITGVTIPMTGSPEQREERFSGKHAPFLLFIIDEGNAVPQEVYKGIESCMSGGYVRLLILFNPRTSDGPVSLMERQDEANIVVLTAFNHPNVKTGRDIIPGAVTREVTVDRINRWSRELVEGEDTAEECFEVPDFLVGETAIAPNGENHPPLQPGWRKVTEPAFYYMVLGIYPPQSENQLISRSAIADARTRWDIYVSQNGEVPPEGVRPIAGLDIAEFGKDSNAFAMRYGGWVPKIETWGDVDPIASGDVAAQLHKQNRTLVTFVDGIGIGAAVAPYMRRKNCVASSIKVSMKPTKKLEMDEFYQLRDQLWWELKKWLENEESIAMIPPDVRLVEELSIPSYMKDRRSGKIKVTDKDTMRDKLKRSPDRAEALMFTFFNEGLARTFDDIGGAPVDMVNTWSSHL